MKSSIYISSRKIEIIGYSNSGKSISVNNYLTYPLPEGTMINGKIIDTAQLVESLASMRAKNPALFSNPSLVVDGSSFLSKKINVPKLKRSQYMQLVRDDFSDTAEDFEELVCDYHPLNVYGSDPAAILGYAADKTLIDSYISAFDKAGIKLKSIRIGVQAILNYVGLIPGLKEKTFVLNVIDGDAMLSIIFENGNNVFMSRTRLFSEDYEQFTHDILENLSGLIQFEKSQKMSSITCSCYLGLSKDALNLMRDINPHIDIALEELDIFSEVRGAEAINIDSYFAYLGALLSEDSIDLIRSRKTLGKREKSAHQPKYWIPVLAGVAVLIILPIVYLYIQLSVIDSKIMQVNAYLNDQTIISKSDEIDMLMKEASHYNDIIYQLEAKAESENLRTLVSTHVLDLLTKTNNGKVSVIEFDFDESVGIIHLIGICANQVDASEYVEALKKNDLIDTIKYTGYSYGREGEYKFSIDVSLKSKGVNQ